MNAIMDKYTRLSLPAKATIWFTICNFVLKGISFITGPIFTRLLPENEYGILSVYISFEQLFVIFSTWEIQLGAYQKGIFKYKDDVDFFTTSTLALTNIITVTCFAVIFIFNGLVTKITEMPIGILALLCVYILLRPAYDCWLARQRKAYNYKAGVTITLIYSIINVLFPMVALLLIEKTANVKFGYTLIASSAICLVLYIRSANYSKIPHRWERTKEYWKFCLFFEGPLVLHSLSYLVLSQADRVMIKEMVGSSQAAFYSVAYSIACVVTIFQTSINSSLSPWRFQMLDENNYAKVKGVTTKLLVAFGTVILLFIMVVPEMMALLFPSNYYEAIWCIPPVATGIFFMFLYTIFVNIEEYYEKTKYVVIVSVSCGLVNIALNYICIPYFGYVACAYTTLFSYILFSIGHYLFMKKTLKEADVKKDVVDGRAILLISIFVIVASLLITLVYDNWIIRYALFIAGCIVLYCQRKRIISLLVEIKK